MNLYEFFGLTFRNLLTEKENLTDFLQECECQLLSCTVYSFLQLIAHVQYFFCWTGPLPREAEMSRQEVCAPAHLIL